MTTNTTDDEFAERLPRDVEHMDGRNFALGAVAEDGSVVISDGERAAAYAFSRGDQLDMTKLQLLPHYIEAGWFCEAQAVTLTDGAGQAVFVPVRLEW